MLCCFKTKCKSIDFDSVLNAFTTGNPFSGTNYLGLVQVGGDTVKEISGVLVRLTTCKKAADDATSEIKGGGHRVPPAGLPIEQVPGEYSLPFPS